MVELRTWKREMRGDGTNHHEKLGLKRISCASQFSIPDMAGRSSDWACNNTDTWFSIPNEASHTPDSSHPLASSALFSSSSPSLSFSSSTLPSLHNTKLSHPTLSLHAMIMSWHWVQRTRSTAYTEYSIHRVQHTPSTAYTEYSIAYTEYRIHRVQHTPSTASHRPSTASHTPSTASHTPSTAYTEYSIHRAQHTPSTASTQDRLSSLHSHDYLLTPKCSFSSQRASLHNRLPSASSPWELKGIVTLSGCKLTNWWKESQHLACRPSTASK